MARSSIVTACTGSSATSRSHEGRQANGFRRTHGIRWAAGTAGLSWKVRHKSFLPVPGDGFRVPLGRTPDGTPAGTFCRMIPCRSSLGFHVAHALPGSIGVAYFGTRGRTPSSHPAAQIQGIRCR